MSTLPLSPELKTQFDDVTTGKQQGEAIRALLVQNINGMLQLVTTEPENSTDKEDFNTVLGKLLAKDTSKPGYALYRLDSKSPAGLYEWINCAYRPEGAKVREKMQYTLTQTSLFKALDEQHFLETVYVSRRQHLVVIVFPRTHLLPALSGRQRKRVCFSDQT